MGILMGAFGLLLPMFIGLMMITGALAAGQDETKTQEERIQHGNDMLGGCLFLTIICLLFAASIIVFVITTFAVL